MKRRPTTIAMHPLSYGSVQATMGYLLWSQRKEAEKMGIIEGSSVVVKILDRDAYAMGCAEMLDGASGVVVEFNRLGEALVEFDAPFKGWWTHRSEVTAFWFSVQELQPVGVS